MSEFTCLNDVQTCGFYANLNMQSTAHLKRACFKNNKFTKRIKPKESNSVLSNLCLIKVVEFNHF